MEKNKLKELLKSIQDNDYKVPEDMAAYDLALTMMDYLGDTDGEFRDRLIFTTLYHWMTRGVLTKEQLHHLLDISLDDKHLFHGLGEVNDTVFSRTFSVLVIAIALYKHREDNFLTKEEVDDAFNKVLRFYETDQDVRGYVEGKGWAHGAAHGADAIDEFARCEEIDYDGLKRILAALHKKINNRDYLYIHEEDERIVTPVVAVLERKVIEEAEMIAWIKSFANMPKIGDYLEDLNIYLNVKTFLRSLYFNLVDHDDYKELTKAVKETLGEIK